MSFQKKINIGEDDERSSTEENDSNQPASFQDGRIRAYYVMAGGPGMGFRDASLRSIRAPFLVDTAQFDAILEPPSNSSRLAELIPGAQEIVRPVGHFTYVPECRAIIGPVLARLAGFPVCDDPPGVDRAAAHEQLARDVLRFFRNAFEI